MDDPSPRLTAHGFFQLKELGILTGERVEFIDDQLVSGRYPMDFHPDAVRAPEADGITLLSCVDAAPRSAADG